MTLDQELRAVLAERAEAWETPAPDFNAFIAGGRARQQRHRRGVLSASAVAVAGALAVSLVVGRGLWETRSTPNPADQPTQESTTSPSTDDRVGFVGPPPPGTPPSGAATGELVAAATNYTSGTWVYADGRLINVVRNRPEHVAEFTGYVVRYLTPSGVEAMRSFLLDGTPKLNPPGDQDTTLLVRDGGRLMTAQPFAACGKALLEGECPPFEHPEEWLPASAWEDPTYRPFIAATFAVCLFKQTDATVLPATVADIFLASPKGDNPMDGGCRDVATADARTMADALEEAGAVSQRGNSLWFNLESLGGGGEVVFSPILPHGGTFCDCG